jgi:hypothetical protein
LRIFSSSSFYRLRNCLWAAHNPPCRPPLLSFVRDKKLWDVPPSSCVFSSVILLHIHSIRKWRPVVLGREAISSRVRPPSSVSLFFFFYVTGNHAPGSSSSYFNLAV